jgi:Ca2+-binding RTX toxin-like protein
MLRRATLVLTLAAITTVVLALGAGMAPAAPKTGGGTGPIQCKAGKVCQGTSGNDTIIGSEENDNIRPMGGDDTVYANGGADDVAHSYGNDYIEGGPGSDTLRGGFGLDTIYDYKAGSPGDGVHDLLDCAYLTSRGDSGKDEGIGEARDTVVDCSNRDDQ